MLRSAISWREDLWQDRTEESSSVHHCRKRFVISNRNQKIGRYLKKFNGSPQATVRVSPIAATPIDIAPTPSVKVDYGFLKQ